MNKITSVGITMERVMKEMTLITYEEYKKQQATLELNGNEEYHKDFITRIIEERLVLLSLNIKPIMNKMNDDMIIIIQDFVREVAIRFVLEVVSDEVIEDSIIAKVEGFINDNFDIKQIITNFSNMDKPKLNPVLREEYKPNMRMKENYMYNQAIIGKARKEFK